MLREEKVAPRAAASVLPKIEPSNNSAPLAPTFSRSEKLKNFLEKIGAHPAAEKSDQKFPTLQNEIEQQKAIEVWLKLETGLDCWGPILEFCNRLDSLTIENKPITKKLVITQSESPFLSRRADQRINLNDHSIDRVLAFVGSNPFTYIKIDPALNFVDYRAIESIHTGKKRGQKILPDYLIPLSMDLSEGRKEEFFVERALSGDILIGKPQGLIAARLRGHWSVIEGEHLLSVLSALPKGLNKNLATVLFQVCLDHSIHRRGALFVIDDMISFDQYTRGGLRRNTPSQLAQILPTCSFADDHLDGTEVKRLIELSAMDGATLLDCSGEVFASGAIIIPEHHSSPEGARTLAARAVAKAGGMAWRVSSDGGLSIYFPGTGAGADIHEIRF